jgi:tRNA threonylcarbamoyladenosine biosynthesis protein TsaB
MIVLALDTTTRAGSAAVVRDGRVVHEISGNAALSHGERLPLDLMHLLEAADIAIGSVDLFAVASGPGSFTGLRVGIATIQGLAMAGGARVVPVSVLEALAHAADGQVTAAWMDAQRGQVFGALYGAAGEVLAGPTSLAPAETLASWRDLADLASARFIGDGAVRYETDLRAALGPSAVILPSPLLAGIIGQIADAAPSRAVLPHAVVPVYVRRPDAEIARAKREAG